MDYLRFSVWFTAIHLGAYLVAGVVNLRYTKDLYQGGDALFAPFLRDVSEPSERQRQGIVMWSAQVARAVLMSVVLYPILAPLADLSFAVRFFFLAGLMFVYADLASATPFSNNIEGLVYMKRRFVTANVFWRVQSEAIVYSLLFGGLASWLAF
ncbi:MAG: hypothetical protein M5U23_10785 [Acidimicrobiia bacterium]|nr:hypothetical protein [Acidimicrobiia bacterium]